MNQRSNSSNHISKKKELKKFYSNDTVKTERPISNAYPEIDTDLARDNIENDLTSADFQDL